jgi:Ca-activated chloride channel homolog
MTFLTPIWLLLLLPVAALAAAYVVVVRRRQRYAVRFASLPMLERVVPRRPGWRRHVPGTLVLLALTCLGLAAARPEMTLRLPYDRATVMVAIDTSGSMAATDVPPNRLEAAKAAAVAFVDGLPDTVNVGIVSFAGSSAVVSAPTTDHAQVQEQIGSLDLGGGGTAIGEAVFSSLGQVERMTEQADGEPVPTRVVLLSDGENTAGRSPEVAAAAAAEAALPVSTIAYGTPERDHPGATGQLPGACRRGRAARTRRGHRRDRLYRAERGGAPQRVRRHRLLDRLAHPAAGGHAVPRCSRAASGRRGRHPVPPLVLPADLS